MAVDKNVAALLNEKARTIHVQFQHSLGEGFQAYTYVTDLPIAVRLADSGEADATALWSEGIKVGSKVLVPTDIRANSKYSGEDASSAMLLEPGVRMSVAIVTAIDDCVAIQPEDSVAYKWVICEIDVSNYFTTKDRNKQLTDLVQDAYAKSLRRSFASTVLAGLDSDAQSRVQLLLGGK